LEELVESLRAAGQSARIASVISTAAWAAVQREDLRYAESCLDSLPDEIGNPGDVATVASTRAQMAIMEDDADSALQILDEAYAALSADIELFGAIDAASQASAAVMELVDQAKALIAPTDSTAAFLEWTDRGRQLATWQWPRIRDPELQILLNRARAVISDTESADAQEAEAAHARLRMLKSEIRTRRWSRSADAAKQSTHETSSPLDHIHLDLTRVGGSWYLDSNGTHNSHWPVELDDGMIAAVTRLGRLMHTAPESARSTLWERLNEGLAPLDELLSSVLPDDQTTVTIGIDESLAGVPWSALRCLWERPYSILPTRKLLGRAHTHSTSRADTKSLLGPGLVDHGHTTAPEHADLTGTRAESIEEVWSALGHRVVQISAHGGPEPENPLFSWLDLGVGKVLLHDLMFLERVPEIVILAACFGSRTESVGPGGSVSFADGFLALGTKWVVAASGTLSDTPELVRFSDIVLEQVAAGLTAPVALANARQLSGPRGESLSATTYSCFGG
ncbi:MAG: hypothetical protein ACC652_07760, partial [Acidimicrobiales bacterium]